MKRFLSIAFLIFGLFLLSYSRLHGIAAETRALSNAMQFEHDHWVWAQSKIAEGKLSSSDVLEIFTSEQRLRSGGELADRDFRQMIKQIVQDAAPSGMAGFVAIILGITGLLSKDNKSNTDKPKVAEHVPPVHPRSGEH